MSYRLYFNETLADGLPRVAAEQVDRGIAELGGNQSDLAEAVHQVRKRCKKIRGLLRLFRGSLSASYSQENAWFRDLARSLSDARDAEAMLECLDSLCEAFSQDLEADAFASVRHALEERRAATQDDADLPQRVQDTAAKLQDARVRVLGWRLDQGASPQSSRGCHGPTAGHARRCMPATGRRHRSDFTNGANVSNITGITCACCGTCGLRR